MRSLVNPNKLHELMRRIGREARGPGRVYFTGGASALLYGWREATVDVDLRLDPEPAGIFEAIRDIKRSLDVNIELASPQDFLPEVPGWRMRSDFIGKHGEVEFFHYDFVAQALSKISRSHGRDLADVRAMLGRGLVQTAAIRRGFEAIEAQLIRFPAIDAEALRARVESFLAEVEDSVDQP